MDDGKTIFVHIPAYRDAELVPTLVDLCGQALRPSRLHVAVCWQRDADESIAIFGDPSLMAPRWRPGVGFVHRVSCHGASIDILPRPCDEARGLGWARSQAQSLYDGEAYSLQLDSHHRFIRGWDVVLVDMLESLRGHSQRPVLTGYPAGYSGDWKQAPMVGQLRFVDFHPLEVLFFDYAPFESGAVTAPVRARFASGNFIFADGHIVQRVGADARHRFFTEQIVTTVRAYTHGYDLYHPHRHVLWHRYEREGAGRPADIERFARGTMRRDDPAARALLDSARLAREMFTSGAPCDATGRPYGLGTARTVAQYECYAGIDFRRRTVTLAAREGREPTIPAPDGRA